MRTARHCHTPAGIATRCRWQGGGLAVLARGVEARYLDSYRARQEDDELPKAPSWYGGVEVRECGVVREFVHDSASFSIASSTCSFVNFWKGSLFSMSSACSRLAIVAASLVAAASGSATVRQPFDPLVLLQDKAAQTTVLRSLARSANLEVATLALG